MKRSLLLFTAILTVLLWASPVYAADIRLSSSCLLADAIIAANRDQPEGSCPAGRGADTIALTRDITLDGGLPKITSAITIEGGGYTISGDNRYRMFYNDGGALIIHDLTITNGYVEGDLITKADGNFANTTANPFGGSIVNWAGTVDITNSSFIGNSAEGGGGAIANYGGTLSISDSAFKGNSAERGGAILNWEDLSISDSSFSDNSAELSGGAIYNWQELSIVNSAFSDNSALWGGAISNVGELSIGSSTFSDNSAERGGGAIYNLKELSIVNSAFSGNSAEHWGGAIFNTGELNMVNSAFGNNSTEYFGGAIANSEDGELSIVNSTFSDNSAEHGGAIANSEYGELSIVNSIIAGGENACYSDNRLRHNIGNFIQDGSCSPAFEGDPKLGELVMPEDGSPAYFPLLAGSRAIDAADDDYCPATDQIGTTRPQGAGCDIGAIEYAAP